MKKSIVLLDGAVGTSIWEKTEEKKPVWVYNLEKPEIVRELCREYIAAGAEIILANTFGANRQAVERSSSYSVKEVVSAGVRIAKEECRGTNVKVSLSAGPLLQLMEPYGDLSEEETAKIYEEQLSAGMDVAPEYRPDCITLQTFMDVQMMRVAATEAKRYGVPVFCLMTFEKTGKTMMGNSVQEIIDTLEPIGVDVLGMNCSLGPEAAIPIIKEFSEKTKLPIAFKPNAGKPIASMGKEAEFPYSAKEFARDIAPALPYVDYIGGCCGSNASYVQQIRALLSRPE